MSDFMKFFVIFITDFFKKSDVFLFSALNKVEISKKI